MSERRKEYRRMEDKTNGWSEFKPLVMDKLDTLSAAVEKLDVGNMRTHERIEDSIRTVRNDMNSRFHIAPCLAVTKLKEDSGKLEQRVDTIDERTKEERRTRWTIVSIGLTLVGLLLGILWNLAKTQGG